MLKPEDKELEEKIRKSFRKMFDFTARKLTDTPTDDLMLVNRRYVNLNGTAANRPNGSVAQIGQSYFATDVNVPMTYKGSNQWVNGVGSIVA